MGTMEQNVSTVKVWMIYIRRLKDGSFNIFCVFQISRLEGQVTRYKAAADNAEKVEDDLKAEKRKLQREVTT